MDKKILIVEDEKDLATILASYLKVEGFLSITAFDGASAMTLFEKEKPDLVLLDIMLPIKDGVQVCKEIREQSDAPIIMISAKDGEMDKVIALGVGADDYVTKPFSPLELVARVKAQLRRYDKSSSVEPVEEHVIQIQGLTLNKGAYTVSFNRQSLEFTTKEFDVLYFLASSPEQVFTKEQIYEGVWGNGIMDENTVSVYVNRIREKLKPYGIQCVRTVWGVGYKVTKEAIS